MSTRAEVLAMGGTYKVALANRVVEVGLGSDGSVCYVDIPGERETVSIRHDALVELIELVCTFDVQSGRNEMVSADEFVRRVLKRRAEQVAGYRRTS